MDKISDDIRKASESLADPEYLELTPKERKRKAIENAVIESAIKGDSPAVQKLALILTEDDTLEDAGLSAEGLTRRMFDAQRQLEAEGYGVAGGRMAEMPDVG